MNFKRGNILVMGKNKYSAPGQQLFRRSRVRLCLPVFRPVSGFPGETEKVPAAGRSSEISANRSACEHGQYAQGESARQGRSIKLEKDRCLLTQHRSVHSGRQRRPQAVFGLSLCNILGCLPCFDSSEIVAY